MRTIDFETVLTQALQTAGLDRDSVSSQTFNQFRDFANFRLKFCWEYDVWPALIRTTAFPVINTGNLHYIIIPDDGIVTNSEGTFKVEVGDIFQITSKDPRLTGKNTVIGFSEDEYEEVVSGVVNKTVRRIIVQTEGYSELYLSYRLPCPELIGDLYNPNITYQPGQTVYWAYLNNSYFAPTTGALYAGKKGNFWKCLIQTNTKPNIDGNTNPASGDKWEKIKIPQFMGQYLVKSLHADWLKSEMQMDYGNIVEKDAMALLDFEVSKIIVQQGHSPKIKFNQIY